VAALRVRRSASRPTRISLPTSPAIERATPNATTPLAPTTAAQACDRVPPAAAKRSSSPGTAAFTVAAV
jgi:hypothetical protein